MGIAAIRFVSLALKAINTKRKTLHFAVIIYAIFSVLSCASPPTAIETSEINKSVSRSMQGSRAEQISRFKALYDGKCVRWALGNCFGAIYDVDSNGFSYIRFMNGHFKSDGYTPAFVENERRKNNFEYLGGDVTARFRERPYFSIYKGADYDVSGMHLRSKETAMDIYSRWEAIYQSE